MFFKLKHFIVSLLILILFLLSVFVGLTSFTSKEKTLDFQGTKRAYRIHLPKGYKSNTKYPVVIALHGMPDNPRILEIYSGLSSLADKEQFIVVYPYGNRLNVYNPYSWNAQFCCGYSFQNKIDDVGFLKNLLTEELPKSYSIDSNRIFMVGFSNGGMLANLYSLKYPETIKALALVGTTVGARYEDEEELNYLVKSYKPLPVIIFHGKYDKSIPFDGAALSSVQFAGAYDQVNFWLENNSCDKHPNELLNGNYYTKELYSQCKDKGEVQFYAYNSGHIWPGGAFEIIKNITKQNVKGTDIIWEYFKKYQ